MRRREFIKLLGGAAATWPLAAHAQQPAIPVIGYLDSRSPDAAENRLRGFRQGLKDAGYIEGENITIVYRWADDRTDQLPLLAAELVSRSVAAIVTAGVPTAFAAKAATTTIPIVSSLRSAVTSSTQHLLCSFVRSRCSSGGRRFSGGVTGRRAHHRLFQRVRFPAVVGGRDYVARLGARRSRPRRSRTRRHSQQYLWVSGDKHPYLDAVRSLSACACAPRQRPVRVGSGIGRANTGRNWSKWRPLVRSGNSSAQGGHPPRAGQTCFRS
jgi:hypothetical protein